ncbi:MAG: hydrogenase maturation protease [Thermoanaerobacteraceae bacterium]|nr:hydrogenase maturation protease [Thermoanaerobacteraceae bacterium]
MLEVIAIRLVVGLGNLLLGDEGIGLHVIQQLSKQQLPRDVQVLDGGTLGPALIGYLEGVEQLYLIDAMKNGGRPGSIYVLAAEEVDWEKNSTPLSMHQLGVTETVALARKVGFDRPITIIGVEPEHIGYGVELAPSVKKSMPRVVETVTRLLGMPGNLDRSGCEELIQ